MPHAQLTHWVRRLVAAALQRVCKADPASIEESIVIRQGAYCGRRFQTVGGYAIWFIEEHQIKLFDDLGRLIEVLQLATEQSEPAAPRLAA